MKKKETPARVTGVRFGMMGYRDKMPGLCITVEMFGESCRCNMAFLGDDAIVVVAQADCKDINDLVGQMCIVTGAKIGESATFVRWWK